MRVFCAFTVALLTLACRDPEQERIRKTSTGQYDPATGKLTEITYDKNQNGVIDTRVKMDGARPVSAVIDADEDGKPDRWEEYDAQRRLVKAGESRAKNGKPDLWVYFASAGTPERIEYSEVSDVTGRESITRREFYEAGVKVRAEEDTDGDGVMDRWETFAKGALQTVEFDDPKRRDGKPAQRLTYDARGTLVLVESEPDASGTYTKRVVPGGG